MALAPAFPRTLPLTPDLPEWASPRAARRNIGRLIRGWLTDKRTIAKAITAAELTFSTGTNGTTATTASFSGTSGNLLLLCVFGGALTNVITTPTISADGAGRTWTQVNSDKNTAGFAANTTVFRALSNGSAGTSTISFGAQNVALSWSVLQITGMDTTTNQGVVQSAIPASEPRGNVTTVPITLSALGSANNMVIGFFDSPINSSTAFTVDTSYTSLHQWHAAPSFWDQDNLVEYMINGGVSLSPAYSGASALLNGVALEVAAPSTSLPPGLGGVVGMILDDIATGAGALLCYFRRKAVWQCLP